jgi:hypothetical protein
MAMHPPTESRRRARGSKPQDLREHILETASDLFYKRRYAPSANGRLMGSPRLRPAKLAAL